ncbi:MAG: nicotinamide riboside transporter PnuC [Bacteroidales bacterium]
MDNNLIEILGTVSGLLYLYLEIKQRPTMWIVGIITSLAYLFVFFNAKIYADASLQMYYVVISFYGLFLWRRSLRGGALKQQNENSNIEYRVMSIETWGYIIGFSILLFIVMFTILSLYTDSPIPIGDAITTSLSIVATWMLAKRYIEHWGFWVVINFISIYNYWIRELNYTVLLYIFYGVFAIVGLYTWKKQGNKV